MLQRASAPTLSIGPLQKILTGRDQSKNYSSPGIIVFYHDKRVMCLQTYCRKNGEKCGNRNSRIYAMESRDLEHWSIPSLIKVKGPDIPEKEMGRMIDPYFLRDHTQPDR